uniref:Uncharacterized protein n=1 Tax=Oryza punctata TaxID=4537 RepID=A0A0E0MFL0_ORYPU
MSSVFREVTGQRCWAIPPAKEHCLHLPTVHAAVGSSAGGSGVLDPSRGSVPGGGSVQVHHEQGQLWLCSRGGALVAYDIYDVNVDLLVCLLARPLGVVPPGSRCLSGGSIPTSMNCLGNVKNMV